MAITFELHLVTHIYVKRLKVASGRFNYQVREIFGRKMFSTFYFDSFEYLHYGHFVTIKSFNKLSFLSFPKIKEK